MIRLHFRNDLPLLAMIGQQGDDIVVAIHAYTQLTLSLEERERLFNDLMREIEAPSRHGIPGVVIRLDDRRERRAVRRTLAEGLAITI